MDKNAKLAAVLNFIVPGMGYIYAQKRESFGWMVLGSMILITVYAYDKPFLTNSALFLGGTFLLSFAFAFDIYKEVKQQKV